MTQMHGDENQTQCDACKRVGEPTTSTTSMGRYMEICYACLDDYADIRAEQAREAREYPW